MEDNVAAQNQPESGNSGSRVQYDNSGSGNQYNNSGSGNQYNANSISFVNKEKDTFLRDLRITDPRDDKTRIERTKGDLLKDSYRWILKHDGFLAWKADKPLLWIKGGPGKGKTMLLCGVIDELLGMGYKSTFFFFCQATDSRFNTATSVLRGLLYLILDQNRVLLDSLRGHYDHAGAKIFEDINSWDVLCRMLLDAVRHESLSHVILVIDALDECTSGLEDLIRFIIDLTAHVKIIVSSRLSVSIDRALADALEDTKIYLSLELNEDVISVAVDNYIRHKVNDLASRKRYDDETTASVQKYLTDNANNTFLWVALVYEQLADSRVAKRHTLRKLQEFPPGLDSVYTQILTQILGLLDSEPCKEVLAVVSIVSRPLDLSELASLLEHVDFLPEILEECASLLTVREGIIYFVHQTAKDFLLRQEDRIMPSGIVNSHKRVLSKLLQTMSGTLRRNIYKDDKHGNPLYEISGQNPDPLVSTRYACVHWADHLFNEHADGQQFREVCTFITTHFLHWLEALSHLRSIPGGILSMYRVKGMIEASTEPTERKRLFRDAMYFTIHFRVPIEIDPMQVYQSALIFSPKTSMLRGLFRAEEPKWHLKPIVNDYWSPWIQSLEGHHHSAFSITFSPDEIMLASASGDGSIKLWNIVLGFCVRTINIDGGARSLAFSADGITLASASEFGIQLWNTVTGQCVQTLSVGDFYSVAFSSDGATLASGSGRGNIELWEAKSGRRVQILNGHRDFVVSLAFSGDGSILASASHDRNVKLWRAPAGSSFKEIQKIIHPRPAKMVTISHNGSFVASLSGWGVKIGNITTGHWFDLPHDQPFSTPISLGFSFDGTLLAVGNAHGCIQLLDTTSFQRKRDLKRGSCHVLSVAFPKNGTVLASASLDASITLWDLTDESQVSSQFPDSQTSNHKRRKVTGSAFSSGGNREPKLLGKTPPFKFSWKLPAQMC